MAATPDPVPAPTPVADRVHSVHRFTGRLHDVLDTIDSSSATSMGADEVVESLREIHAAQARLAELTAALIRQAEVTDVASRDGAVNLTAWLRQHLNLTPAEAHRQVRLAHALAEHEPTRAALAAGTVSAGQAEVVTAAVDQLPRMTPPDLRDHAEHHLLTEARSRHVRELKVLGVHLVDVVDPGHADERLADHLERLEAKAARQSFLDLWHDEVTGTTELHGRIPLFQGIKLARIIDTLTNPARKPRFVEQATMSPSVETHPTDQFMGTHLTASEQRGHALTELLDRMPLNILPKLGRNNATVVVTMTLDTLLGGLTKAGYDTNKAMSPSLARKLAADSGVIPAVLGTQSEVLDLGRRARLYKSRQRLAMRIQQKGCCGVEGCDRPATWGEANHLTQWQHGGTTDLINGILLCQRHHTLADHNDYEIEYLGPGRIRITRRKPDAPTQRTDVA